MMGLSDPFNRGSYPWGREDPEIRSFVMRLSALRRRNAALSSGKTACVWEYLLMLLNNRKRGEKSS